MNISPVAERVDAQKHWLDIRQSGDLKKVE